jgi:hypothetical protein
MATRDTSVTDAFGRVSKSRRWDTNEALIRVPGA